jgi:peptidoglycan biosynthesis protein MviN/MurJ (putative lipid II flippase)
MGECMWVDLLGLLFEPWFWKALPALLWPAIALFLTLPLGNSDLALFTILAAFVTAILLIWWSGRSKRARWFLWGGTAIGMIGVVAVVASAPPPANKSFWRSRIEDARH